MVSQQIIQNCKKNDRIAQKVLYEFCYATLIKVAKRYQRDDDEVADIINQSFLKIIKNIDQLNEVDSAEAWIARIGINTAINIFRTKKVYKEKIKLSASYNVYINDEVFIDENSVDKNMESKYIFDMIANLPEMTKQVLNLFAIDGYSHKEISEMLEIKEELSRWHLFKARKLMAEQLENFKNTNGDTKKIGNE